MVVLAVAEAAPRQNAKTVYLPPCQWENGLDQCSNKRVKCQTHEDGGMMQYYCLMVKTGGEEKFKKALEKSLQEANKDIDVIFFKKKLRTRKNVVYEQPLFSGYVFLGAKELDLDSINLIKKTVNFYHFLNSNSDIRPLQGQDLTYILSLLKFGKTQGLSKAYFNENMRIVVTDGPLVGLAGKIFKVNRRQQRVTVLLEMFHTAIKFDLGYELIKPEQPQKQS